MATTAPSIYATGKPGCPVTRKAPRGAFGGPQSAPYTGVSWTHGSYLPENVKNHFVTMIGLTDGSVLPVVFSFDDVRAERKRQPMWWH